MWSEQFLDPAQTLHVVPVLFSLYSEHTYEYLVEQQPIGEQLFRQFCSNDPQLARCIEYITAVKEFNMVTDEKCVAAARSVFDEYISTRVWKEWREGGSMSLYSFLTTNTIPFTPLSHMC